MIDSRCGSVSVLFARADSCYFDLVIDVWDASRDASNFRGPNAVVAHPPCRGWGRFSKVSNAPDAEKDFGVFAVDAVRRFGGVLEHPHASKLWAACGLPRPGVVDAFGGFTVLLDQGWFGHAAPKPTWIYVVGMARADFPALPVQLHRAAGRTLFLSVADRERTPPAFAAFLVSLAARCYVDLVGRSVVTSIAVVTPTWPVTSTGRRSSYLDLANVLLG